MIIKLKDATLKAEVFSFSTLNSFKKLLKKRGAIIIEHADKDFYFFNVIVNNVFYKINYGDWIIMSEEKDFFTSLKHKEFVELKNLIGKKEKTETQKIICSDYATLAVTPYNSMKIFYDLRYKKVC